MHQGKFEAFVIMVCKRMDAKIDTRKIETFFRTEFPSDNNTAMHFITLCFLNH